MPVLTSTDQFLSVLTRSGLVEESQISAYLEELTEQGNLPDQPKKLASRFVRDGHLTRLQAVQLMQGKSRGFLINGKYRILELLGSGGMGRVFLAEHLAMRRLVALKVLPIDKTKNDPLVIARFYREARAVASLNHPNIVHAHDIDRDEKIHFLAMEYVDGKSLHEVVRAHGPLGIVRAAHYVAQAAAGLQHAHEGGWVHRDIKPGNLILDRSGTVKITDLGLARLFDDQSEQITKKYDRHSVLGTADYLAPEQALCSSGVDIRADIYSLGATFHYLLTGLAPFPTGTVAQKLVYHQMKQPQPIGERRPDMPLELEAIIQRMMAKEKEDRFASPREVVEALRPWTDNPISPPPPQQMPHHSPAVLRICPALESYDPGQSPSSRVRTVGGIVRAATETSELSVSQPAPEMETAIAGPLTAPTTKPKSMPSLKPATRTSLGGKRASNRWLIVVLAMAVATSGIAMCVRSALRASAAPISSGEPRPSLSAGASSTP